jgi:hypothetical protein
MNFHGGTMPKTEVKSKKPHVVPHKERISARKAFLRKFDGQKLEQAYAGKSGA